MLKLELGSRRGSGRGSGNDASASEEPGKKGGVGGGGGGGGGGGWRGNLVKCLHAQLGDRLVRGESANPVGDLVLRRLEDLGVSTQGTDDCWRECAPPSPRVGGGGGGGGGGGE